MKLDEQALRRADFAGGTPILLCDQQEWTFPEPAVEFVYDPEQGFVTEWSIGPEYGPALEAAMAAAEGADVIRTELRLAWLLLTRNYDLTVEQFRALVRFNVRDEAREAMRRAITEVANGVTPKPSGGGSA
jgi:hypothetical protein